MSLIEVDSLKPYRYRVPVGITISVFVGFVACQWQQLYLLSVVVIMFWALARTRVEALLYVAAYSVFSTWVVVPAIIEYLNWNFGQAVAVWILGLAVVFLWERLC